MKYTLYTLTDAHAITATEAEAPEHDGYLLSVDLAELSRRGSQFAQQIRSVVRGLWVGALDIYQAYFAFDIAITRSLTQAWYQGAAECGIRPADMSPEERIELEGIIANERSFVFAFLLTVELATKEKGGKLVAFAVLIQQWALRYDDVVNRARIMSCADQKLRWTNDYVRKVKKNCKSCLRLNGKVKRASYWYRAQVQPQHPPNPKLDCGGWRCGCGVPKTDEPLSRGPLPNLP